MSLASFTHTNNLEEQTGRFHAGVGVKNSSLSCGSRAWSARPLFAASSSLYAVVQRNCWLVLSRFKSSARPPPRSLMGWEEPGSTRGTRIGPELRSERTWPVNWGLEPGTVLPCHHQAAQFVVTVAIAYIPRWSKATCLQHKPCKQP